MQEPRYPTIVETRNISIGKNITIDSKSGERAETAYNAMNEKNVNKTHLHISNTTKIPATRKASNN